MNLNNPISKSVEQFKPYQVTNTFTKLFFKFYVLFSPFVIEFYNLVTFLNKNLRLLCVSHADIVYIRNQ